MEKKNSSCNATADQNVLPEGQPVLEDILAHVQKGILDNHSNLLLRARMDAGKKEALRAVIQRLLVSECITVPRISRDALADMLLNEIIGYGPIDPLIRDPSITEIMVNGPGEIYVERNERIELTDIKFRDEYHVLDVLNRIVGPLGRRIDKSSPYVDARLPDGSRVNAIIPPLALNGPTVTIRKFRHVYTNISTLVINGTLSPEMAEFLKYAVKLRLNIIISGGTGSGKTTTLNALASSLEDGNERVVTIEDNAEILLNHPHVVSLESRPPNMEGKGEVSLRQLLRNALRMRPDRIIIGEVRGPEAFDLLQALNTGHRGSISTIHANSPSDALYRFEDMVHMAGENLPHDVVINQIRSAVDMVIHQARLRDGSRKVVDISLVDKCQRQKVQIDLVTLFRYDPGNVGEDQGVESDGHFERVVTELPDWFKERTRWYGLSDRA